MMRTTLALEPRYSLVSVIALRESIHSRSNVIPLAPARTCVGLTRGVYMNYGEPHIDLAGNPVCGAMVAGKPCGRKILARGWCSKHYQRWLRHGDANRLFRAKCPEDVVARFWDKVNKSGDCWLWTSNKVKSNGGAMYGSFMAGNTDTKAHRFSYALAHGDIPDGYEIDHICGTHLCVNPEHLRLATGKQNCENLTRPRADNTSGVRGVFWNKQRGRWTAGVRHHGKYHHCGYFDDIAEAESAVVAKRNELFTHNVTDRGLK